jgi:hypothetical protein
MNELHLKSQREYYKGLSCESYKKWKVARNIESALRKEWDEYRELYETYDRQLAEIDGRKTTYPLKTTERKVKKDITLTRDQVLDLASKLGIVLNLDEDKEDGEELDFES